VWLLLHGVPLSPEIWDDVRCHLPGATVAPDLNDTIAEVSRDGLLQYQIAAKILAGLPDGELVVVGHSFGGWSAYRAMCARELAGMAGGVRNADKGGTISLSGGPHWDA
jgi:pimeloyl-ACP methyl ester carboxylesterase